MANNSIIIKTSYSHSQTIILFPPVAVEPNFLPPLTTADSQSARLPKCLINRMQRESSSLQRTKSLNNNNQIMRKCPPVNTTLVSSLHPGEEGDSFSYQLPPLVTPISHFESGVVANRVTPDDAVVTTANSEGDETYAGRCQKSHCIDALEKAKDDAKEAAVALENLVRGVQVVRRFLQTPLDAEDDSQSAELISELSSRLVGVLGSELLGLMNAADMVRDHAKLHAEEASALLEDLSLTKEASNKSNDRADIAETASRRLYMEKQSLLHQVSQLRLERRSLAKEVKILRRTTEDTKKFDTWRLLEEHVLNSVAIHEMVLKTPTSKSSNKGKRTYDDEYETCDAPPEHVVVPNEIDDADIMALIPSNGEDLIETGRHAAANTRQSVAHAQEDEEETVVPGHHLTRKQRALAFPSGMSLGFGRFKRHQNGFGQQPWDAEDEQGDGGVFECSAVEHDEEMDPHANPNDSRADSLPHTDEPVSEEVLLSSGYCSAAMGKSTFSPRFGRIKMFAQRHAARSEGLSSNVTDTREVKNAVTLNGERPPCHDQASSTSAFQNECKKTDDATQSAKWSIMRSNDGVVSAHSASRHSKPIGDEATGPTESSSTKADDNHISTTRTHAFPLDLYIQSRMHSPSISPLISPEGSPFGSNEQDMKPLCDRNVLRTLAIPSEGGEAHDLLLSVRSSTAKTNTLYEC